MPHKTRKGDSKDKIIFFLVIIITIQAIFLIGSCQKKVKETPIPKKPITEKKEARKKKEIIKGKIAIVLDDWGYSLRNIDALKKIEEPLTLSVLPNLPYSAYVAKLARENRLEVILHLPLEPKNVENYRLEEDTILVGMQKKEILQILESDFKSLGTIKGVSNHMGSKATEDRDLMKIIFTALKKKKLFFLDSYTSDTVCKEVADTVGLSYIQRDVFLDNKSDYEYISGQLGILARLAEEKGYAVGIGHDRTRTLEVLSKAIPELKKKGFRFVFVSQLLP